MVDPEKSKKNPRPTNPTRIHSFELDGLPGGCLFFFFLEEQYNWLS